MYANYVLTKTILVIEEHILKSIIMPTKRLYKKQFASSGLKGKHNII